ncbi:hypothetical protein [Actinomadura sp. 6N118]|uniref:hypothetical protein n=1 Tax=Actinomadura sp. 6N118 TaxID=3375151 RepID=UPI0037ABB0F8
MSTLPGTETAPSESSATTVTAALLAAVRGHYQVCRDAATSPDLLVEQVAAPGSERRCDLLRIGVWPSRGQHIDVHEIKASRSDWRRELNDPGKADAWWPYCHRFWIVAPLGLIRVDELPDGWGLMAPPARGRRKCRIIHPANVKEPKLSPQLLVEIARRIDNRWTTELDKQNQRHARALREAVDRDRAARAEQGLTPEIQHRLALLDRLEQALGLTLHEYAFGGRALATATPEQAAAALADYTAEHLALQRRANELNTAAKQLLRAATHAAEAASRGSELATHQVTAPSH